MSAKVLFLTFDGADPGFLDAMIADGELPALAALRARSTAHDMENDPAMGASNFWTCASIGAGPAHHGHYFYMQFKPDTYDVTPNHESSLPDITPFWNALDREGFKVALIDWHRMTPKPLENGFVIDNWFGHDPLTEAVHFPASLAEETKRYFNGDPCAGGFACKKRDTPEAYKEYLFHLLNHVDVKAEFCSHKLRDSDWDLFVVNFSEAHDVGHYYYHVEDASHERFDPALAKATPEPLRQCYRRLDEAAAKLIAAAGEDAEVFVLGGPGMGLLISANEASEEMIRRIDLGVEAPRSGAETVRESYRSFIPLGIRRRLSPLGRALRRRVVNHDYARRRFFAVPHNDNACAVRINVKGREKYGTVAPGAEYDAVVQEITDAAATFKNPDTGRSIVKRVVRVHHDYEGPHLGELPDLYLEWDRTATTRDFRKIVSDTYGEIAVPDVLRTGDHNDSGFYWTPKGLAVPPVTRPAGATAPVVETVRKAKLRKAG